MWTTCCSYSQQEEDKFWSQGWISSMWSSCINIKVTPSSTRLRMYCEILFPSESLTWWYWLMKLLLIMTDAAGMPSWQPSFSPKRRDLEHNIKDEANIYNNHGYIFTSYSVLLLVKTLPGCCSTSELKYWYSLLWTFADNVFIVILQ